MLDHGSFTSSWNPTALYVEPCFNGKVLSNGSSFLWAHDSRIFLVTNWHVLSGRNAKDGSIMHKMGGIPNELKVYAYRVEGPRPKNLEDGGFKVKHAHFTVPLFRARGGREAWIEHPRFRRHVDVAAIDVTAAISRMHYECVNRLEGDKPGHLEPGDEVFVVGFPFGLIKGAPAPIWKRGSIALDPGLNPEGLPKMLVDTATREGMSGSVVIGMFPNHRQSVDPHRPVYGDEYPAIIGVYSGRHYPDLEKAQLGIVWKREVIEELVASGITPLHLDL